MLITTKAIVFSTIKYSEADLIAKCYSEKSGLKTYMLRGILKSKKGKLKASLFQPLTQLEIVANHKDKGALEYMREAKVLHTYQSLHTNVVKSSVVFFLAEILRNSIKEEEPNLPLYHFLETTFNWFDLHDSNPNFHLLFLLKLSRHLGFYPNGDKINSEYFNLLDGTFQMKETNAYCIQHENLQLLKQLLGIDFEELEGIKLNQARRSRFLQMLLEYYQLHLQGFKKPKSLSVLNEIFS